MLNLWPPCHLKQNYLIAVLNYMESRVGLSPEKYGKSDRMDLQEKEN